MPQGDKFSRSNILENIKVSMIKGMLRLSLSEEEEILYKVLACTQASRISSSELSVLIMVTEVMLEERRRRRPSKALEPKLSGCVSISVSCEY